MARATAILPYTVAAQAEALERARRLAAAGVDVVLAGPDASALPAQPGIHGIDVADRAEALRRVLANGVSPITLLDDPGDDTEALLRPIEAGTADAVFGLRPLTAEASWVRWADRALSRLAKALVNEPLVDPLTPVRAFRTSALRGLALTSRGSGVDAEILVKLSAQRCRILEVPLLHAGMNLGTSGRLDKARTLLRYAAGQNAADDAHEGFNTLERMDDAHHYNAWIGRQMEPHLGRRVLEVGAGIGTITREIEAGRELLIALEMEAFYVERLKNLFRDKPHVRPVLSGVERADWERLQKERLDTVVLSNVLEHIADDAAAVRNFRLALQPGGALVTWVPALPGLYGSLDEAVGHFRRYSAESLRAVLEGNGFAVEKLEWMNRIGIPGWWLNSVVLSRRAMPKLQLRVYDAAWPLLAQLDGVLRLPTGLSLFAVARAV